MASEATNIMALVKHGILMAVLPSSEKKIVVWPERRTNQKMAFDRIANLRLS